MQGVQVPYFEELRSHRLHGWPKKKSCNIPLSTALATLHKFWYAVLNYHSFLISEFSLLFLWFIGYVKACFAWFIKDFLDMLAFGFYFHSIVCILSYEICWLIFSPHMCLPLWTFYLYLKKNVYSGNVDELFI